MNSNVDDKWEEFLNPEILRPRLSQAAIIIIAFELLKATIVDRIRGFFLGRRYSRREHGSPREPLPRMR